MNTVEHLLASIDEESERLSRKLMMHTKRIVELNRLLKEMEWRRDSLEKLKKEHRNSVVARWNLRKSIRYINAMVAQGNNNRLPIRAARIKEDVENKTH